MKAAIRRAKEESLMQKKEQTPRSRGTYHGHGHPGPRGEEERQSRPIMTCNAKWLLVVLRVTLSEIICVVIQNGRLYTRKKTEHFASLLFKGFPFTH